MKICFVSHSSELGGAERVLLETVDIFREKGVECKVILPSQGPLCDNLSRMGIDFDIISYPLWMGRLRFSWLARVKTALGIFKDSILVAWKILRWQSDIVYTNTATVCVGALASRLVGRPHVWHLHEFGAPDQGLYFIFGERFSLWLINKLSSRCICVSRALARAYERAINLSKIAIIYPPMHSAIQPEMRIDCRDITIPARTSNFRCVIVGALIEGKGQADGVLAVSELKKLGVAVELLIVGDGIPNYRDQLQQMIQAHRLEALVFLAGPTKEPLLAVQASDVVLVCSRSEAFGRVTLEGMLAGKPVIGANSGSTPELLKDGVTGLLYKPFDAKDLATKIRYLRDNPDLAQRIGKNGQSWALALSTKERFWNSVAPLLESAAQVRN